MERKRDRETMGLKRRGGDSRMEQIDKMTVAVSVAPLAGPVTMKEEALCEMIKRTVSEWRRTTRRRRR